jgi:aminoglycoside phosphotransferase
MIHGDFNETNILVDDSEKEVCGILDFGNYLILFLFYALNLHEILTIKEIQVIRIMSLKLQFVFYT